MQSDIENVMFCGICGKYYPANTTHACPGPVCNMPGNPVPDLINHPPHYTAGKTETIDIIAEIVQHYDTRPMAAFDAGQVIKYVARAPLKGAYTEDLKKARWYLDHLIGLSDGRK